MQGKDRAKERYRVVVVMTRRGKKKRMLTTLCVPVRSPITVLTQPDRV